MKPPAGQRLAAAALVLVASVAAAWLEHALALAWAGLDQRQQRLVELQQFAAKPTNWPALAATGSEVAFPGEVSGLEVSWRRQELGLVLAVDTSRALRAGQRP